MLVESAVSIDRRLPGASKSLKDTRTDLKRIELKLAAEVSKNLHQARRYQFYS